MRKSFLDDRLPIKFLNDPDVERNSVRAGLNDIFEIWRKGHGQHYPAEQLSRALNQLTSIWFTMIGYRRFLDALSKTDAYAKT